MVIEKFTPTGGYHCITNSLKQVFEFYNYPISEQMLFGLGSGIGFVYVNLGNAPMISCRIRPIEFENNISERLSIGIKVKRPKNAQVAYTKLKESIDKGKPVMLYADMPFLNYLNMQESGHFGGHSIVVFGYDENEQCFFVSDRDNSDCKIHTPKGEIGADYHKVPYKELEQARNSNFRPFPANNKWVDFDFSQANKITTDIIRQAIKINTDTMLNAPAHLLGINGINKFAKETKKWRRFDEDKKKLTGITNYFMISEKGGTGGGAFRKMYGEFLIEAAEKTKQKEFAKSGKYYLEIANLWNNLADEMMELYHTGKDATIEKMSEMILGIAEKEKLELERLKALVEK